MDNNIIPIIKPIKVQEFSVKQSKYEMIGKLPTRSILCGPSGAGKGVLLANLVLDVYRDCFSRICLYCIFSEDIYTKRFSIDI